MTHLILALLVWSVVHFFPAIAVQFRAGLVTRIGALAYKGLFALVAFGSLLLLIKGWKTAPLDPLYTAPAFGGFLAAVLTFAAAVLFFAPYSGNSLRRLLRHPQLCGVIAWGAGHLLANGESRSVVLFGGLALWAWLEMLLLNRRDGPWKRPEAVPLMANLRLLLTGAGFWALVLYTHERLFGVNPVPYLSP